MYRNIQEATAMKDQVTAALLSLRQSVMREKIVIGEVAESRLKEKDVHDKFRQELEELIARVNDR